MEEALPPAIIGGAIAGAAALGGAAISSGASKSAANSAANAAAQNNALQKQIYDQNTANETPFMQRGNAAGSQINALLGLGGSSSPNLDAYLSANPDVAQGWQNFSAADKQLFPTPEAYAQWHYQNYGQGEGRAAPPVTSAADAATNAFTQFHNSDGYQFRLGQGLNAVNTNYALRGAQGSGAAMKGLNDYAQGQASNEFGNYMGQLQTQQGVGLSAANALNGVGTNYANAVGSNNNNAASAAGNAAISSGNAWSNALGTIGGNIAQLTNSSYGGGNGLSGGVSNYFAPTSGLVSDVNNTIASNRGYF